jgi:hypothetical protein
LGHSLHENGTVILSRGANGLSEPRRCSNIDSKPGGNRNIFVKSSVALEIREKFLVYKLS